MIAKNGYKTLVGVLLLSLLIGVGSSTNNSSFCSREDVFNLHLEASKAQLEVFKVQLEGEINTSLAEAKGDLTVKLKDEQRSYHNDLKSEFQDLKASITKLSDDTKESFDKIEGKFDKIEGKFDKIEGKFDKLSEDTKEWIEMIVVGGFSLLFLVLFVVFPATTTEPVTEFLFKRLAVLKNNQEAIMLVTGVLCAKLYDFSAKMAVVGFVVILVLLCIAHYQYRLNYQQYLPQLQQTGNQAPQGIPAAATPPTGNQAPQGIPAAATPPTGPPQGIPAAATPPTGPPQGIPAAATPPTGPPQGIPAAPTTP